MGRMTRNGICLAVMLVFLLVGLFSLPGAAQTGPAEVILEKPQPTSELPGPEETKKRRKRRPPPAVL